MDARPRATAGDRRVYEDFVPSHELREEGGAVPTFVVRLPGFKREQIRVQVDNYGKLRISGERPLADNRWSRFRKDFQAPENCNVSDVRAKFENEVLEVVLPKLTSEPIQPRIRPPQKPEESQKPASEAKPITAQDDTKPKAPAEPNGAAKKQQEEEKKREQIEERKVSQEGEEQRKDEKHKEKVAAADVGKGGEIGDAVAAKKEPESSEQAAAGGVRNGVGKLKQKLGELGLAFYKPRHPMVNVVVAIVVLVGVGMYLYYKLSRPMLG